MSHYRRFAVALVLAAFALAGCNEDDLPPAGQYSSVTGTVLDRATQKPIAGAVVTVDAVLTATTDATGKFTFEKVPSGIVDYTLSAQGYKPVGSSVNAEPGKPFELDVSLDQAPPQ